MALLNFSEAAIYVVCNIFGFDKLWTFFSVHSGTPLPLSVSQRCVALCLADWPFAKRQQRSTKLMRAGQTIKLVLFSEWNLPVFARYFRFFCRRHHVLPFSIPLFWLYVARAGIPHLATKPPTQPTCRVLPPVSIYCCSSCRPFSRYIGGARFSCCATYRRLWDTISLHVRWLGRLSHHQPIEWTITRSTAVNEEMGLTGPNICSTFRAAQEVRLTSSQWGLCKLKKKIF